MRSSLFFLSVPLTTAAQVCQPFLGYIISVLSSHAVCLCIYLVCIGGISATVSANFLYTGKICSWTDGKRRAVKQTRSQQIHCSDFFLFSFKSTTDQPPEGEASASTFFPQLPLTMWWCSRGDFHPTQVFPSEILEPYQHQQNPSVRESDVGSNGKVSLTVAA